jgi:hypothetical protein
MSWITSALVITTFSKKEWRQIFQHEYDRRELLRPAPAPTDTLLRPSQETENAQNLLSPLIEEVHTQTTPKGSGASQKLRSEER